jgi:hypothetical protein
MTNQVAEGVRHAVCRRCTVPSNDLRALIARTGDRGALV